ncbi:DUF692 domain-containing protein [Psychromonas antarctica]|uniref:MNIO family bufferin maturase n=1 Tax=Psychromonas antarctica TaxID=67573 RepID=UPI001EE7D7DE|nr:DUF692 domain-containing protein [Psychromonas antarctica]MCG6201362.1 DUF692 domain-containing protein [Psychromonas antarctica]
MANGAIGIGLRAPHYQTILSSFPEVGFLEIHSENYFNPDSKNYYYLEQIAPFYPMSFHGIGLSLGSSETISKNHLDNLKQLVDRFQPALVSDHLSWSSLQGNFFNDLLPIPYSKDALSCFVTNVNQVQDHLQREILIENPSSYLEYKNNEMSEPEFINEIAKQTGCGLLLDLNNIYVSATNHDFSVESYLDVINKQTVKEIHLAGFTQKQINNHSILIDTHSTYVSPEVWDIYHQYIKATKTDAITLIEWDADIPPLDILIAEHNKAKLIKKTIDGGPIDET